MNKKRSDKDLLSSYSILYLLYIYCTDITKYHLYRGHAGYAVRLTKQSKTFTLNFLQFAWINRIHIRIHTLYNHVEPVF